MADRVDQVNMHDAMLSTNIFSVKDEQYQEDSFVEDKVYISETAITTDNAEFQGGICPGKLKQTEESTCLDNIKTEIATLEVTEKQNDEVKIEGGISTDNIKVEFDNGLLVLLYCEHCEAYYKDYCIECGMLLNILNNSALNKADNGAREDIPNDILEIQDLFGQTGIYALRIIPAGVKFGPFTGLNTRDFPAEMKGEKFVLDKNKSKYLNWMQYVNPTKNTTDHNLHVFQCEDDIYYQSNRAIQAGEELLVYFGEEYSNSPNNIVRLDFVTIKKDIVKDVFACTFCCLGFSSKLHLVKHKTVCVNDTTGKFSIKELMQCPFCKIHLDQKEYFEHHMTFCCERKCVLPTTLSTKQTTALNRRKKYLRQIYKCWQCKYRTKYQADLKEHTNTHHYKVKMYKCGVCNGRFKTEESLRLHVENTHAYVGGEDDQEHPMTSYGNTHIEVEQSSSLDQKKIFKCSLCMFHAKYKGSIRTHINTHHLKQFNSKCDSCDYRTNSISNLEVHIKAKHTKELDYKCDSCEYSTSRKDLLKRHMKTKHTNEFDYKCDSCEYRTNDKTNLKVHIKTKHLKQFDYECDSCEFKTNHKHYLKVHIKAKHSKEFDFKCNSCEYSTCRKDLLKRHMKTKHTVTL